MSHVPTRPQIILWLAILAYAAPLHATECVSDHPDRASLVGTWSWVYTRDYHGDPTPGEGESTILQFNEDGTFQQVENGTVTWSGEWCLRECTPGPEALYCSGQIIISLGECGAEGNPACERGYRFCSQAPCTPGPVELNDALQLDRYVRDLIVNDVYERINSVSAPTSSWSTLKGLFGDS